MFNTHEVAERIKTLAKERNVPLREMLSACGLGINTISQFDKGRVISAFTLARIAEYLDCSVDYLLGIDNKNNASQNSNAILESIKNLPPNKREIVKKILTLNDDDFDKAVAFADFLATQNNHSDD